MIFNGVGILGIGLWNGTPIENSREQQSATIESGDPFRGRRASSGDIEIAGLSLSPTQYPRTLETMRRTFTDPFRGTERRRRFPENLPVSEAEADAGRNALADAALAPADVDVLLIQSFLADQIQPNNAALVAHKLGIDSSAAWGVDSTCNSLISQLSVAGALVSSGAATNVLCIQSCAYSRVSDPSLSSHLLEGDLAAAVIVGPSTGRIASAWRVDGSLHAAISLSWQTLEESTPWWRQKLPRLLIDFNKELQPATLRAAQLAATVTCGEAMKDMGWDLGDLDLFISHQPCAWMVDFISETLGVGPDISFDTFRDYGTVNAPGITASLFEAARAGRLAPGSRILAYGPSAGYTFGALALDMGGV